MINVGGNVADALRRRGWRTVIVRKISLAMGEAEGAHAECTSRDVF